MTYKETHNVNTKQTIIKIMAAKNQLKLLKKVKAVTLVFITPENLSIYLSII